MKRYKLLLVGLSFILLIVGCEEPTEPAVTSCSNCISGHVKDNQGNAVSNAAIIFQYYLLVIRCLHGYDQ